MPRDGYLANKIRGGETIILSLNDISNGISNKPRRCLLYGMHGVGKSTWASESPAPIFIQTEDGLNGIKCEKFPLAKKFFEVESALKVLLTEPHDYQTVAIDSLDWLERLIWAEVCSENCKQNIEDIGYARGYKFALSYWEKVLTLLDELREKRGMTTLFLAHSAVERFDDPDTEPYDRYAPRLHKYARSLVCEWVDEIFFAYQKIIVKTTDDGFNKKRNRAVEAGGERVMRCVGKPSCEAKNRLGMADHVAFTWHQYEMRWPSKKGAAQTQTLETMAGQGDIRYVMQYMKDNMPDTSEQDLLLATLGIERDSAISLVNLEALYNAIKTSIDN